MEQFKLKPITKIVILVALLGAAVGGYRLFGGGLTAANPNNSGSTNPSSSTGNQSTTASTKLSLQASGTYQAYLEKLADDWRTLNPEIAIEVLPSKESRDTLQFLIEMNRTQRFDQVPDFWLASSDSMVQSLSSATKAVNSTFANVNDTRTYMVWPPQPLVVLCKSASIAALQGVFMTPNPVSALRGQYRFSFSDPLTSGGGHSALAYMLWSSKGTNFSTFLKGLKAKGYVPLAAPTGGLAADFAGSQLDFIFTYNALADREIEKHNGQLAKIVPATTVWERPSMIALRPSTGWSPEREKAIRLFAEYVRQNPPYVGSGSIQEVQVPKALDSEKRQWEMTFDGGARLNNINAPSELPAHP